MMYFARVLNILIVFKVVSCQTQMTTISSNICPDDLIENESYCHKVIENTTFPFECPFKSTIPLDNFDTQTYNLTWMNLKRDEIYGYFEYPKLHPSYGYLFFTGNATRIEDDEDCLLRIPYSSVKSTDCNNKFRGVCSYSKSDTQYCDAYNKICNVRSNCHCRSKIRNYLCQAYCSDFDELEILKINAMCLICDEKFERYPQPEIFLKFDQIDTITVKVQNPLKLIRTHDQTLIYCFTDVIRSLEKRQIKLRYFKTNFTVEDENEIEITYNLKIVSIAVGYYWCEGYSFPNAEKVESNKILVGLRSAYGLNFVLNFTLDEFNLAPYDIHVLPVLHLQNITDKTKYQLIRLPEPPPLFHNRRKANLTVHLTTFPNITNAEDEYEELVSILERFDFKNYSLGFSAFCLGSIINSPNASWPMVFLGQQTPPREILLQENGLPITRRCQGSFMKGAYWSDVIGKISNVSGSEITDDLHQLANSNKTADELNQGLWDIASNVTDVVAYDVHLMAQILGKIALSNQAFDLDLFVWNVNTVTQIDSDVLQLAQDELNSTDHILYNVDLALGAISDDVELISITAKNLMAWVMRLDVFEENHGFAVYQVNDELQFRNLTNVASIDDIDLRNLRLATFIPSDLLRQILSQNSNPSLIAAVYINDMLFRSSNRIKTNQIASFALSIYVTGFSGVYLEEPLPIIFSTNLVHDGNLHCGFWEYGIDEMQLAIHGRWRKSQAPKLHDEFKLCTFSHMTHFAILVNAPRNRVLDLISLIGCALSIFGVIGIIITAFAFKTWRDSAATKILLNLSLNILAEMLLFFLLNIQNRSWCKVIAIGLHYIIVSQFCWMLVIGYLQYRKFVQVLLSEPPFLLLVSYFTGWLIPILPVVITYFLYPQGYSEPNYCYLVGFGLYFGLFLPVGCVILSNVTVFFLIFASLSCTKIKAFGDRHNLVALRIKLCVILFFLLGFSWLFGFLAHFLKSMVLSYTFCITTTMQGFVLYIYFVLCNKTTRKFWVKKFTSYRILMRWAKGVNKKDKRDITKAKY